MKQRRKKTTTTVRKVISKRKRWRKKTTRSHAMATQRTRWAKARKLSATSRSPLLQSLRSKRFCLHVSNERLNLEREKFLKVSKKLSYHGSRESSAFLIVAYFSHKSQFKSAINSRLWFDMRRHIRLSRQCRLSKPNFSSHRLKCKCKHRQSWLTDNVTAARNDPEISFDFDSCGLLDTPPCGIALSQ